jgi:hypothetical protein
MRISNQLRDVDRHYLNNLIVSGLGEIPDKDGKVSSRATHKFVLEKGFIVAAIKIMKKEGHKK